MKTELHSDLIARYFDRTASEQDLNEISEWLKENPAHQRELAQLQKLWAESQKVKTNFDTHKAWQSVASRTIHLNSTSKKLFGLSTNLLRVAASLLAVASISIFLWVALKKEKVEMLSFQTTNESKEVLLPDGSLITLNAYSSVQFPEKFGKEERKVSMIGEAFFEVSRNPQKPFVIDINTTEVRVLGTSFNINSRDTATIVSVRTGKVKFGKKEGKQVELIKGQEAKYVSSKDSLTPVISVDPNVFAFKTQVFYFENTALKDVVSKLSNAYHTTITLEEKNWENYTLTATFERQKLENILDIIGETLNISIEKGEKSILIKKRTNLQ